MLHHLPKYFFPLFACCFFSIASNCKGVAISHSITEYFTTKKGSTDYQYLGIHKIPVKSKLKLRTKSLNDCSQFIMNDISFKLSQQFLAVAAHNYMRATIYFSHKCSKNQLRGPPQA
ncbi:MAG: hypothetical protein JSS82_20365 [Bacteroidetes bacterium]|nr:hypothetical protein [Bacteroidota bacterium]